MYSAALFVVFIILFVLISVLKKIHTKSQEALKLEEKLGRETYNWLIGMPSVQSREAIQHETNNEFQLDNESNYRELKTDSIKTKLKLINDYLQNRTKKEQSIELSDVILNLKSTLETK
jgi:ABC-type multidrug transport system fused ATPase/permease subunit